MNYTETYRLPQWEAADKIKMSDFNDAMSAIDTALSDTRSENAAFSRACRLAYNHYHAMAALGTIPHQLGLFHQELTASGSGLSGFLKLDDHYHTGLGTAGFTAASFRTGVTQESALSIVINTPAESVPLSIKFTPTAPAFLRRIQLSYQYHTNVGNLSGGSCLLTLTNQDGGTVDVSKSVFIPTTGITGAGTLGLDLNTILRGGCTYQLKLTPQSWPCYITVQLTASDVYDITAMMEPLATATHSFREAESSLGGLVVAHYNTYGTGGEVELSWDGGIIQPADTRAITDNSGRSVIEAVFRKNGAVPASSTVVLRMKPNVHGDMAFYRWGAVLL